MASPKYHKQSNRTRRAQVHQSARRNRSRPRNNLVQQDMASYVAHRERFIDTAGERYCATHLPASRRSRGVTLTPANLVERMVEHVHATGVQVARIVDPGAGTGRFTIAAARAFPSASIVAIENDRELASLLLANLSAARLGDRVQVLVADYREIALPRSEGPTLFIGNPPYVRHHDIDARWKHWYMSRLAAKGIRGTQLAGLHAHFLVKTIDLAQRGDLVCYVTAAEWLDTGYGAALRELLLRHGRDIDIALLNRNTLAFDDAMTTSVITSFRAQEGERLLRIRAIDSLDALAVRPNSNPLSFRDVVSSDAWSKLAEGRRVSTHRSDHFVGNLFSVHRGQVTGSNSTWIAGGYPGVLPESVLIPAVTRAKELLSLDSDRLLDASGLKRVIDLPHDWSRSPRREAEQIERFIDWAKARGAQDSYIAQHRTPWFKVRLREPAPIIVTYMARRPPKFVRNLCGARLVNIAHGLYPREPICPRDLDTITAWLNVNVSRLDGRTYAGGLTKFEPGEIERLRLPSLDELAAGARAR